jgi:hypothetical protein
MGLFRVNEAFAKNGVGTGMKAEDVAAKHGVPVEMIEDQIEKGMEVELEHTSDLDRAREIAIDHLVEFPDYYDRLMKMEEEARAEEQKLAEEFSEFLSRELNEAKTQFILSLSEAQLNSDQDVLSWADWKLTKFNLRSVDESFIDSFLGELHGDHRVVATMTRRDKVRQVMEAADRMPRNLKSELISADKMKGDGRKRVISSALKSLKK